MKKLIIALIMLLGVLFLLSRFTELSEMWVVLQRGDFLFLGLALLIEVFWIYNLSAFYRAVYHELGMTETPFHMARLVTAGYFLSVVAPSAGLSSIAVYLADAQRRGHSTAKVTVASILYVWFEYIGIFSILIFGLEVLNRRNRLHWSEIIATLLLLGCAMGLSLLLYLAYRSSDRLGKIMAWLANKANRLLHPFLHRTVFEEEKAYNFSQELAIGISVLRNNPRWIAKPLLFTLLNKISLLVILTLCFLAFEVPVDFGIVIAGLGIAHLFLIISPTPAGIGVVEGILAISLNSLGIPLEDATVITLSYRGLSFWVPFFVGMVNFRLLDRKRTSTPAPISGYN
jgi:uncharacterized protein (TIRG00374 family)